MAVIRKDNLVGPLTKMLQRNIGSNEKKDRVLALAYALQQSSR